MNLPLWLIAVLTIGGCIQTDTSYENGPEAGNSSGLSSNAGDGVASSDFPKLTYVGMATSDGEESEREYFVFLHDGGRCIDARSYRWEIVRRDGNFAEAPVVQVTRDEGTRAQPTTSKTQWCIHEYGALGGDDFPDMARVYEKESGQQVFLYDFPVWPPRIAFSKDENGANPGGYLAVVSISNGPVRRADLGLTGCAWSDGAATNVAAGDQLSCPKGPAKIEHLPTKAVLYSGSFQ